MIAELSPLLNAGLYFAWVGGLVYLLIGIYLSIRHRHLHPLLLLCISALSFSWIEAPYDWAVYAQFPPALPRMPEWWPMSMTWGGLPSSVPFGYMSYFVTPALVGVHGADQDGGGRAGDGHPDDGVHLSARAHR